MHEHLRVPSVAVSLTRGSSLYFLTSSGSREIPAGSMPAAYLNPGTATAATYLNAKKTGAAGGWVSWIKGADAMAAFTLATPWYFSAWLRYERIMPPPYIDGPSGVKSER